MRKDVTIGYLRREDVAGHFMESLLRVAMTDPRVFEVHGVISGPAVAVMRNKICARVLYQTPEVQWLWFVDTDMTFEPDILRRLLEVANARSRPVVGGLCFAVDAWGQNIKPTIYMEHGGEPFWDYPRSALIRPAETGGACLLIHRSVLETLADHYSPMPWFQDEIIDEKQVSEDRVFCRRLAECGIPLHVHTGIKLGHVKSKPWGEDDYLAQRAASEEEGAA